MTDPVRASGALLFRRAGEGFEVLCVHRPKYDDWSLPKGKDDPGESPEAAAVREVEEETGYRGQIIDPLAEVRYPIGEALEKAVRYFAMRPVAATEFTPNPEVDEIRWVPAEQAIELLSYPHDRRLVAESDLERLAQTRKVFLVRHAAAGSRSDWTDDDRIRPLTEKGHQQAEAIAATLAPWGIDRILSSEYIRCRQTVEPLARRVSRPIEEHPALAEGADWRTTLEAIHQRTGFNLVACSHGDVIPELLRRLADRGTELRSPDGRFECKKASIWTLRLEGDHVPRATYQPPPGSGVR